MDYTLETDLWDADEGADRYHWEAELLNAEGKTVSRLTSQDWTGEWCVTREEAQEALTAIELAVARGELAPYFESPSGKHLF